MGGELEEGGQKVQSSSYKLKSPEDVVFTRITVDTALWYNMKVVKRVIPNSSHREKKHFFSFFCLYLCEMMDVN